VVVLLTHALMWLSRLAGHGGLAGPGRLALRLDPTLLSRLAAAFPQGVAMVTGTNGKTTTATLVEAIGAAGGLRVVRNRSGANLLGGLLSALVQRTGWRLKPSGDVAVLETDEATVPRAAPAVRPRVLAVTNVFRDQLDRYGEVTTTVRLVARGVDHVLPEGALVLNADDPQVAALGLLGRPRSRVVYFGLEADHLAVADDDAGDARFCPRCGTPLSYRLRLYAHLGHWACAQCGLARPRPDILVRVHADGETGSRTLQVSGPMGDVVVPAVLPGTYNAYNVGCAVAVAAALGLNAGAMAGGLASSRGAFGRMEAIAWQGQEIRLALVKNPAGFNQVLRAVAEDRRPKQVVVAINDRYADGRDVSWLWDVDLERWAPRVDAEMWYAAGTRAADMAVRLKYSGVPPSRIETVPGDPDQALTRANAHDPASVLYVLPTYTAMMDIRARLERAGVVRSFREG
jgi:UDP-N-acetylmuramyl tripeptide synthase